MRLIQFCSALVLHIAADSSALSAQQPDSASLAAQHAISSIFPAPAGVRQAPSLKIPGIPTIPHYQQQARTPRSAAPYVLAGAAVGSAVGLFIVWKRCYSDGCHNPYPAVVVFGTGGGLVGGTIGYLIHREVERSHARAPRDGQ
jgi:hypothetical protein